MGDRFPTPVLLQQREDSISVHQLRAGHWCLSTCNMHRIGRHPTPACRKCDLPNCKAAYCQVCREERDKPEHMLLRCPCLTGTRLRLFGTLHPAVTRLQGGGAEAALVRGYVRPAVGRRLPARGHRPARGENNNNKRWSLCSALQDLAVQGHDTRP